MASIYKQGKTWTVKVSIPLGNGIYTSKYETGFHTKNEAKVYANKLAGKFSQEQLSAVIEQAVAQLNATNK